MSDEDSQSGRESGEAPTSTEQPSQLHDGFVKQVFSSPAEAKAELMAVLPEAISKRVVWSTLKQEPSSYVDRANRHSHGDLVFSFSAKFRVADGEDGERDALFLHVLEHQSTPDPLMAARLWGSVSRGGSIS